MLVKLKWSRRKSMWAIYHVGGDNCLGYSRKLELKNTRIEGDLIFGELESGHIVGYTQVGIYQLKPFIKRTEKEND